MIKKSGGCSFGSGSGGREGYLLIGRFMDSIPGYSSSPCQSILGQGLKGWVEHLRVNVRKHLDLEYMDERDMLYKALYKNQSMYSCFLTKHLNVLNVLEDVILTVLSPQFAYIFFGDWWTSAHLCFWKIQTLRYSFFFFFKYPVMLPTCSQLTQLVAQYFSSCFFLESHVFSALCCPFVTCCSHQIQNVFLKMVLSLVFLV